MILGVYRSGMSGGLEADDDALAEAVARLPGDAALPQPVQRAVQGVVVLDIELDAPVDNRRVLAVLALLGH